MFNEAVVFSVVGNEADNAVTVVVAHTRHRKNEDTLDTIPESILTNQVEHRLEDGELVCPQYSATMTEIA